jgi:hypothetical protein
MVDTINVIRELWNSRGTLMNYIHNWETPRPSITQSRSLDCILYHETDEELRGLFNRLFMPLGPRYGRQRFRAMVGVYDGSTTMLMYVRFEVFTSVTMKNSVFWDVTLCGSCMNRRFRGTSVLTRATRRNILEDGILQSFNMMVTVCNPTCGMCLVTVQIS